MDISTSPAASPRQDVRLLLSTISNNTKSVKYLSQLRNISSTSETFMDPASPWKTRDSKSSPCENLQSFTPQPSRTSLISQDEDLEPSCLLPNDATMASLISRMQDKVVIRDMAVQAPKMVNVLKGYALTYDTKPADHFEDRHLVKVHVKRKRDEGMLSKPPRKTEQNYGFRAHEVNSTGAVSLQNCQASSLTNNVHPLLARARFDDTPDAIYDQLVPALRLASMFLTQPVCMQFWVTLAFAERKDDREMSVKYGKRCQRIDGHVEMTEENITTVIKRLEDMGNANLIHFAFRNGTAMPQADIWACSWPIRDYRGAAGRDLTRSIIRLHADYYTVAEKLSRLKYPEQSQNLRFSFIFAVIVLHELAHSIEGAYIKMRHDQWLDLQHSKQYLEPFFMDWQRPPECGRTLEQTMFGGEIHPINKRVDGSHGVCTSDWPPRSSMGDSQRRIWYTVPMQYIQDLFRIQTWQRHGHLHEWKTFHIPRTGATSLYIFSFTTMPWSEGQRAANEEAAELLAITKAQPATKKRLIASGQEEEQRGDEKTAIETVIGKDKAAEVENRLSRSRRHSSFMLDTHPGLAQPANRSRRSRSVDLVPEESLSSQDEAQPKAVAEDLLQSFLEIYDGLPARRDSDKAARGKPTSELVKQFRSRASETTPRTAMQPTTETQSSLFKGKGHEVNKLKKKRRPRTKTAKDQLEPKVVTQTHPEDRLGEH